jgi:hypothetical protein
LQLLAEELQRTLHSISRRNGICFIALTLAARIVEAV